MTLHVLTARITSRDADALNITRKSAGPEGLPFAPSWPLLMSFKNEVKRAGADPKALFEPYRHRYIEEMQASWDRDAAPWDALLARWRVVLTCYCTDPEICHRTVLARDILTKCGAVYLGEFDIDAMIEALPTEPTQRRMFGT